MTITEQVGASAPASGPRRITTPGVYPDLTAEEYHADPVPGGSLSSTGARRLLPPSCPALFRHEQDTPQKPRRTFELGHAAHRLVLGDGPDVITVDYDDWRTKAAREARDEIRAAGAVPLLQHEGEELAAMANALRAHPIAGPLFIPGTGQAEVSLFWQDNRAGTWLRARPDWVKGRAPGGRLILADYKTCRSAAPDAIERDVHAYGYHQQAAWYLDGIHALGLGDYTAQFVFVFQEKTAPYLITVCAIDDMTLRIGAAKNRRALTAYQQCRESGVWPGYCDDDIPYISLPAWAGSKEAEEYL